MKTITHSQFLQLLGLLTLAHSHVVHLNQIQKAVSELLKVEEDEQYSMDATWSGDFDALRLVNRLGITVEPMNLTD